MSIEKQNIAKNAIENVKTLGAGSTEMTGYITENKPDIPYIEIRFFTKAAIKLLFSDQKTEGQTKAIQTQRFIHGADWFNSKMENILDAIRADDPFADQALMNIEDAITELGNNLEIIKTDLINRMNLRLQANNATAIFNENMHCESIHITYKNRISYELLWLLKQVDDVFYYLYLCDKYAIMDAIEVREIRDSTRTKFRSCMTIINDWTPTSISREDMAQNTKRVAIAWKNNARIGLTQEVLMMTRRAKTSPLIPVRRQNVLDPDTAQKLRALYKF